MHSWVLDFIFFFLRALGNGEVRVGWVVGGLCWVRLSVRSTLMASFNLHLMDLRLTELRPGLWIVWVGGLLR